MKNEDFSATSFSGKTLLLEDELLNLVKNPPPRKEKEKNPNTSNVV